MNLGLKLSAASCGEWLASGFKQLDTSRKTFHERAMVVNGVTDTYAVANKPWVPI